MEKKEDKVDEKVAENLLQNINSVISKLEEEGLSKEASILHRIFVRLANKSNIIKR
jgi:predicted transcriptional regulator